MKTELENAIEAVESALADNARMVIQQSHFYGVSKENLAIVLRAAKECKIEMERAEVLENSNDNLRCCLLGDDYALPSYIEKLHDCLLKLRSILVVSRDLCAYRIKHDNLELAVQIHGDANSGLGLISATMRQGGKERLKSLHDAAARRRSAKIRRAGGNHL